MVSINNSPKETFSEKSYGFYKSWCSSKNAGHLYYNANLIGITAIKTALKVSLNGYIWQNWTIITEHGTKRKILAPSYLLILSQGCLSHALQGPVRAINVCLGLSGTYSPNLMISVSMDI